MKPLSVYLFCYVADASCVPNNNFRLCLLSKSNSRQKVAFQFHSKFVSLEFERTVDFVGDSIFNFYKKQNLLQRARTSDKILRFLLSFSIKLMIQVSLHKTLLFSFVLVN